MPENIRKWTLLYINIVVAPFSVYNGNVQIPEPLLYILGIEYNDVPENKKEIYKLLFPSVHKLAFDILSLEN